jgi:hypothetical protein
MNCLSSSECTLWFGSVTEIQILLTEAAQLLIAHVAF